MTAVVVDTDVASAIHKGRLPQHLDQLITGRRLAITFVTVGELTQWTHLHRWGPARRAGLRLHGFGSTKEDYADAAIPPAPPASASR